MVQDIQQKMEKREEGAQQGMAGPEVGMGMGNALVPVGMAPGADRGAKAWGEGGALQRATLHF